MSQKDKLRKALVGGAELSSKQIRAKFGIASPTKVVSRLRLDDGLNIRSNRHEDTRGRVTHKFSLVAKRARRLQAAA